MTLEKIETILEKVGDGHIKRDKSHIRQSGG